MTKETIELTKLVASLGMTLTNGESYGKEVYLGINDSADNWYEITDDEADKALGHKEEVVEEILDYEVI